MMMKKKVIIASVRMPLTHQFFHLGHGEGKHQRRTRQSKAAKQYCALCVSQEGNWALETPSFLSAVQRDLDVLIKAWLQQLQPSPTKCRKLYPGAEHLPGHCNGTGQPLFLFCYSFPTPWTSCRINSNKVGTTPPLCTASREERWPLACCTLTAFLL